MVILTGNNYLYSQGGQINYAEILINNETYHEIFVKVFPVGAIFSGNYSSTTFDTSFSKKYSLKYSNQNSEIEPHWPISSDGEKYIAGGVKFICTNDYAVLDF